MKLSTIALAMLGAWLIEASRQRPVQMPEPKGEKLIARFVGGPLNATSKTIPNARYFHHVDGNRESAYMRLDRTRAGQWLYLLVDQRSCWSPA